MAPTFVFRPLAASDLPLLAEWLARPHVAERWGAPADAEGIAREYGDAIASDVVWHEKAGLRRVATIATPDGPALLMVIRREDSARS
jgi:hypothetical protein